VYAGLKDICISLGERVACGREIGKIDEKRNSINFQIGHHGKPVDPLRYLPKRS
jgi:septal ring factor EnvC (AmiA/AmiB activator)